jgi:NAD(P)-dependent dehydrogenase (short-subunit alcohol dehydrogenase family)
MGCGRHLDAWINNDARGTLAGTREAVRVMTAGGHGGVIVDICSTAGFEGTAPGMGAYMASKHAVRGLTQQSALELAPHGIRVLAVAPNHVPAEGNTLAAGDGPVSASRTTTPASPSSASAA